MINQDTTSQFHLDNYWKISSLADFNRRKNFVGKNNAVLSENYFEGQEVIHNQELLSQNLENFTKSLLLYDQSISEDKISTKLSLLLEASLTCPYNPCPILKLKSFLDQSCSFGYFQIKTPTSYNLFLDVKPVVNLVRYKEGGYEEISLERLMNPMSPISLHGQSTLHIRFNEKVRLKKIFFAWNGQRIPQNVNICVDNTEYFVLESNMRVLFFDEDSVCHLVTIKIEESQEEIFDLNEIAIVGSCENESKANTRENFRKVIWNAFKQPSKVPIYCYNLMEKLKTVS